MKLKSVFLSGVLFLGMFACDKEDVTEKLTPPSITEFSPGSGAIGTSVTISGNHFGSTVSANEVFFTQGETSAEATIQSASSTSLQVTVPADLALGSYAIVVKTNNLPATSTALFNVTRTPQTITALSATTVVADGSVTITGTNFSTTAAENIVTLVRESAEPVTAVVTAATATSLEISFPDNITPAEYTVRVTIAEHAVDAASRLTVNAPVPAPTVGAVDIFVYAGNSITISGTNFSSIAANNQVHLVKGNTSVAATITTATQTTLQATVPASTEAGVYTVKVTVGGKSAESSTVLTVMAPHTITSFTPTSGESGSRFVITGTNFSTTPANNIVRFNQDGMLVSAWVIQASATSLTVEVPENVFSGNHFLEITINNHKVRAAQPFTVTSYSTPVITSVTPTTLAAGSTFTITGTNFSHNMEVVYVVMIKDGTTFRLYPTEVSVSPTEIVVQVPSYYEAATYTLEVHKGYVKGVSASKITVTR